MATPTMTLGNKIAEAIATKNVQAVTPVVNVIADFAGMICGFCTTPLTDAEIKAQFDASGTVEPMCDNCANEAPTPEVTAMAAENARLRAELAAAQAATPTPAMIANAALKAELAAMKAPKPVANTAVTPKPAAVAPVSVPVVAGGNAKTDAFLLGVILRLRGPETTTVVKSGKNAGTTVPKGVFAVKVHAECHRFKIPETMIREALAGAVKRNILSKMGITTKTGATMILWFDAKVRPNTEFDNTAATPAELAAAAKAFGM